MLMTAGGAPTRFFDESEAAYLRSAFSRLSIGTTVDDHDDTKPPPCPWCGKPEVHEHGLPEADVRSFSCRSCSKSFVISIRPLKSPGPQS